MNLKYPPKELTVLIRDDAPMLYANDTPIYRSVTIQLTDEQVQKVFMREHEHVSNCFFNPPIANPSAKRGEEL